MELNYKKIILLVAVILRGQIFAYASSKDLEGTVNFIYEQITYHVKPSDEFIVIPPFLTFENKTTTLGKLLSEKLISKFTNGKKITPVERDFIFKLVDEMKLGMTGFTEPKTIQQVGKFSGASYVLVGAIQKIGKDIQVNSRLVRTETSKVEKSVETILKTSPEILELLSQEIQTPPLVEENEHQKLMRTDFEKIKKDYTRLQDELEKLKQEIVETKNRKKSKGIREKITNTKNLLTANECYVKGNVASDLGDYNSAIEN